MASQIFSGGKNFSYTNNTGQNVRIIINYFQGNTFNYTTTMSWAGITITMPQASPLRFGRNLAFVNSSNGTSPLSANNMQGSAGGFNGALPTEIMIASGQTFAITGADGALGGDAAIDAYNIVIIPENG